MIATVPARAATCNHSGDPPADAVVADPIAAAPKAARAMLDACPAVLRPLYLAAADDARLHFRRHARAWLALRRDPALDAVGDAFEAIGEAVERARAAADRVQAAARLYGGHMGIGDVPRSFCRLWDGCDALRRTADALQTMSRYADQLLCEYHDANAVHTAILILTAVTSRRIDTTALAGEKGGAA